MRGRRKRRSGRTPQHVAIPAALNQKREVRAATGADSGRLDGSRSEFVFVEKSAYPIENEQRRPRQCRRLGVGFDDVGLDPSHL